MPDIIDIASEREALFRERAIAEARRRYRPMPITGRCYHCEEKTTGNFCCPECRAAARSRRIKKADLSITGKCLI